MAYQVLPRAKFPNLIQRNVAYGRTAVNSDSVGLRLVFLSRAIRDWREAIDMVSTNGKGSNNNDIQVQAVTRHVIQIISSSYIDVSGLANIYIRLCLGGSLTGQSLGQ